MEPAYRATYPELYRRHWWWRAREAAVLAELRRIPVPPLPHRPRILDVGCGEGLFFEKLQALGEVEGVEPDPGLQDPAGPWRAAIHPVPFDERFDPGRRYDIVLMLDVLEHLSQPEDALRHAIRLLAPGGGVLLTVPAFSWLWTRHDDLNRHLRRYDRPSLRRVAQAAGLRIDRERYLFQWTVPAKLIVRAWERVRPGAPKPPAVPPAPLNWLLRSFCRVELAVAARVPFPFGSSLLVRGGALREPPTP